MRTVARQTEVVHEEGGHEGRTPTDSRLTMHENARALRMRLMNDLVDPREVSHDVRSIIVLYRHLMDRDARWRRVPLTHGGDDD